MLTCALAVAPAAAVVTVTVNAPSASMSDVSAVSGTSASTSCVLSAHSPVAASNVRLVSFALTSDADTVSPTAFGSPV